MVSMERKTGGLKVSSSSLSIENRQNMGKNVSFYSRDLKKNVSVWILSIQEMKLCREMSFDFPQVTYQQSHVPPSLPQLHWGVSQLLCCAWNPGPSPVAPTLWQWGCVLMLKCFRVSRTPGRISSCMKVHPHLIINFHFHFWNSEHCQVSSGNIINNLFGNIKLVLESPL